MFGLTACIACVTYIPYQLFATADIQAWNYPDQKLPQLVDDDAEPLNVSNHKNGIIVARQSNDLETA